MRVARQSFGEAENPLEMRSFGKLFTSYSQLVSLLPAVRRDSTFAAKTRQENTPKVENFICRERQDLH